MRLQVEIVQPGPTTVTISIGLAAYNPGDEVRDWLRKADLALYAAKRAGRNCVADPPE